ncbi:MAG: biotin--[acetyl-CoA-carboxylase] ligase [Synergistaceae bacterium]|jgi:BirA family biotin operon repressor/biotin-[acetyl-CoA-carboxylase] ligase|nr:biotin--[acetyl-CoA-carboxylase] ligase [Synergistaceae bacterium]
MSLKNEIISTLEKNRERSVSGEYLAQKLSVSRSAIWKAIGLLKKEGYGIDAFRNRGYRLSEGVDVLSEEGIMLFLKPERLPAKLIVFKTVDSTNREAKKMAVAGGAHGTVLLADEQTSGRGRFERSFFSPAHTGIYMSFILKPRMAVSDATLITVAAAVAVCRAISGHAKLSPRIKWVNDIILDGKKICGILTESILDFESGSVSDVILGIGLNFSTPDDAFPDEFKGRVGSLYPKNTPPFTRNEMAAAIIDNLLDIYESLTAREFISEYKELSCLMNREISYSDGDAEKRATVVDIDEAGRLVVRDADGIVSALSSGEVGVHL